MEIVYSDKAVKQLRQLYKSQKSIAQLIINKILSIKSENSDIKILEINHRKEVYRDN